MSEKKWVVYLLRCSDNSLYCGISNTYKSRLIEHNSGKGAKYTRSRRPVDLMGISSEMTKSEALKLEHRIKKFPADKKISELKRKENKLTIKKDLQVLRKEFKALEKKMEKLIAAVEKNEKPAAVKKITAKSVKAKPIKKAPAKKAPAGKKTTKLTATDHVLKVLK